MAGPREGRAAGHRGGVMSTAQEALSAAYQSWNAGDLNGYLSLYDEGIALHGYSPEPMDKTQVRGFYEAIFAAFGGPKLEFHEVLWNGDAWTIRFTMTCKNVDACLGLPATEPDSELTGITILAYTGVR